MSDWYQKSTDTFDQANDEDYNNYPCCDITLQTSILSRFEAVYD